MKATDNRPMPRPNRPIGQTMLAKVLVSLPKTPFQNPAEIQSLLEPSYCRCVTPEITEVQRAGSDNCGALGGLPPHRVEIDVVVPPSTGGPFSVASDLLPLETCGTLTVVIAAWNEKDFGEVVRRLVEGRQGEAAAKLANMLVTAASLSVVGPGAAVAGSLVEGALNRVADSATKRFLEAGQALDSERERADLLRSEVKAALVAAAEDSGKEHDEQFLQLARLLHVVIEQQQEQGRILQGLTDQYAGKRARETDQRSAVEVQDDLGEQSAVCGSEFTSSLLPSCRHSTTNWPPPVFYSSTRDERDLREDLHALFSSMRKPQRELPGAEQQTHGLVCARVTEFFKSHSASFLPFPIERAGGASETTRANSRDWEALGHLIQTLRGGRPKTTAEPMPCCRRENLATSILRPLLDREACPCASEDDCAQYVHRVLNDRRRTQLPQYICVREMEIDDVASVMEIQHACYRLNRKLLEDEDVFVDILRVYPDGCRVATADNQVVGYMFSHPYDYPHAPALNRFLGELPERCNSIFVHDVSVHPPFWGQGVAGRLLAHAWYLTRKHRRLHGVSVQDSYEKAFNRFGFRPYPSQVLEILGPDFLSQLAAQYEEGAMPVVLEEPSPTLRAYIDGYLQAGQELT